MVFKGTYEHSVDPKGRMFVPAKFREGLGDEEFVICKGFFNRCLYAFSKDVFDDFSAKMNELSLMDENALFIERELYANASDVEVDKQGRILIPASLRTYAGLDKDVVVVGVRSRVEIWNRADWESREVDSDALRSAIQNLRAQGVKI